MRPEGIATNLFRTCRAGSIVLALLVVACAPTRTAVDDFPGTAGAFRRVAGVGCGPTALLEVVSAYDLDAANRLRRIMAVESPVGGTCSFHDLASWAERAGVEATGLKVEWQALARLPLPAIVHLRPGHFVVLHSVSHAEVEVSDRGSRRYRLSRGSFEQVFSGNVLCLPRRSTAAG